MTAERKVCDEIISIMETYDEQEERGCVDTPGGFEHLGDVWRTMRRWQKMIAEERAQEARP